MFEADPDRRARPMSAIDAVNDRFGRFTAVTAAQCVKREWLLRSGNKSARTTRVAEVPTVRA